MRFTKQLRCAAWVCVVLLVVPLAVAWAECGHCAIFSGGSCPAQFCDDLGGGRTCGNPVGTCTLIFCRNLPCPFNSSREDKISATRNRYDCVVGTTHYDCFGNCDQGGGTFLTCCDCP